MDLAAAPAPQRSSYLRSWLIALLFAACYTLAYLDRQIISLLVRPIESSLHISDTRFGLLQGVSFSLFYVAASLPLAWLADRTRRSWVMSACVAAWSVMTMACGLAGSFWQLLLARIGVAAGEAGLTPAALATLSERFDKRRLATATSLFMLAPFAGGGLALSVGAAVYGWSQHFDRKSLPLLGGLADWQLVFVLIGAPGMIAALLLLLISDRPVTRRPATQRGFGEVFALFRQEWRIYVCYQLAMAAVMTLLSSYITWLPAAIMRSHAVSEQQIGSLFGPVYFCSGVAGTLSAGIMISLRAGQDAVSSVVRYMLVALALLCPAAVFGVMAPSLLLELVLMGVTLFLISSVTSLSSLTYQYITPRRLRAQALAVLAMVSALFGTGLGPILAGVMSDHMTGFRQPLAAALSLIALVTVPLTLLLLTIVLRSHKRRRLDLEFASDAAETPLAKPAPIQVAAPAEALAHLGE